MLTREAFTGIQRRAVRYIENGYTAENALVLSLDDFDLTFNDGDIFDVTRYLNLPLQDARFGFNDGGLRKM